MILLITAVLFGIGFAYLATQNTTGITLFAGGYIFPHIPVYILVLGSLLVGLFLAWFLSSISAISSFITIKNKDGMIHKAEEQIDKRDEIILALREQLKELAIENSNLEEELHASEAKEEREKKDDLRPNLFHRFHHA